MSRKKLIIRATAILLVMGSVYLTWRWFDSSQWWSDVRLLLLNPSWLGFMFVAYMLSFLLKAAAWRTYEGSNVRFGIFIHGLFYSLLINHLLPVKAGDAVRTGVYMKHSGKTWDEALHSVAVMRLLDMLVLGAIGGLGIVRLGLPSSWLWISILAAGAFLLAVIRYMPFLRNIPFVLKHSVQFQTNMLSKRGALTVAFIALSWILEAGVVYGVARIFSLQLGGISLIWANSMTIAGQIFHITPGGIGTYESTMSVSLAFLGVDGRDAYRAALLSHTFKFLFAYAAGAFSLIGLPLNVKETGKWIKQVTRGNPDKVQMQPVKSPEGTEG